MKIMPRKGPLAYALAHHFKDSDGNILKYKEGQIEKAGRALSAPLWGLLDKVERNFKNPVVIIALTAIALFAVTIIINPAFLAPFIGKIVPLLFHMKPWMIKFTIYITIQFNILSHGIKAFGRFNNKELYNRWENGEIEAFYLRDLRNKV